MKTIEINKVTKRFGRRDIIKDADLSFENGKCYIVTGDNGCGKSTLIKVILGLYKKTSGEYILHDKRIGYIPEKISFPEYTSVHSFLYNLGRIRKMDKNKINNTIGMLLKNWEIEYYSKYRFNQLSKGTLQKILIIQAIMHSPNLYIFDEPLSGLDTFMKEKLINLIEYLKFAHKTIIIISHFSKMFERVLDCHFEIRDNRIIQVN